MQVQRSLLPFSNVFTTVSVEDCKTVQDVVNKTIPFSFKDCKLLVTVNNELVDPSEWATKTTNENDIIGLNFVPQGGKGGKTALSVVITIAAVAAAMYAAPLAVGALGLAEGTFGAYAVSAGMYLGASLAASMAIGRIMAVPKQTTTRDKSEDNVYGLSTSNNVDKWGVVPINLGVNRMYPKQAATPYTENIDNDQYLRQLFTWGYGNVIITNLKLGDTALSDYTNVETEHKLNGNLNTGTSLFSNDVYQEDLSIALTQSAGYVSRTTRPNSNEAIVDITFQGLVKYDDSGNRTKTSVQLEVEFAPSGTEDWSIGSTGTTLNPVTLTGYYDAIYYYSYPRHGYRIKGYQPCYILINKQTGSVETYSGANNYDSNIYIALGYIKYNESFVDLRSSLVGKEIANASDFQVSVSSLSSLVPTITVSSGTLLGTSFIITGDTSKMLRKSYRMLFPTPGQYDVRVKRLTTDSTSDRLIDASYWTALRSVTYTNPVNFPDISGSALRIKATDQLNGSVNSLNAIVQSKIKSYDPENDVWVENVVSSNPADIFRYVLQCPAFAKAVNDEKIDLEKLKEWWIYCDENNLTYNRIIDYETSIDDVLNDVCAAGMATLSKVDNIYSVIIDNERPIIKGMITPRNSWDYEGSINYPDLPHGLRVEFRNAENGYETDERLVFRDGYDENNATLYERLQFPSCTNADLAYWYGKRYFATAMLQPETHTFKMDFENLTFNRGDRVTFVNDVILVGVGQGRIKELIDDGTNVTGFKIDDMVSIPNTNNFGVRIRNGNGSGYTYHLLTTQMGQTDTFTFAEPIAVADAPGVGSLCAFVEDGKELDLIITQIQPGKDHTATITAVNYAPERFNPLGPIPPFESNITSPWEAIIPVSPVLGGDLITDMRGLIKNSDGSYLSTMIVPLINKNIAPVEPIVKVRASGTTEWIEPQYVIRQPENVTVTGLQDGTSYDIRVYYARSDASQQLSVPLQLNNIRFVGGSEPPADVTGFKVSVLNGIGLFEWDANEDFDFAYYIVKFDNAVESVSWNTSQIVYEKLQGNSLSLPIHEGTYLIKAVDYFGNESRHPATIISYDSGAFNNVIERLTQEPDWNGVKEDVIKYQTSIRLADGKTEGYYYLDPAVFDLSDVYSCLLLSEMKVDVASRGGEERKVRSITNIRSVRYIRSTDEDINWAIRLELATSLDGVNWSDWKVFTAAQHVFRYIKFRVYMQTDSLTLTPQISKLSIIIDMPDRYESGEDLEITTPTTGLDVEYTTPFRAVPSVNITVQDGATDDKIEFSNKTNEGFTIKVFNATLNTYVARSFDYIAAGYGRKIE